MASRPTLPVAGTSRDARCDHGRDAAALTWQHFPKGFAEQPTPRHRILIDIPYGKIEDVGIQDYGEFLAGLDYAWHLLEQPPTVDGRPGQLSVVDRYLNAIQLKWRPADG